MRDAMGLHKVGSSNDALWRRRAVQSQISAERRPVRLVRAVEVEIGTARRIEANAHRVLAQFRRDGEWFGASMRRCNAAVNSCLTS